MKNKANPNYVQKNMVDFQIQNERQNIKIGILTPFGTIGFFLFVLHLWKEILFLVAGLILMAWLIKKICGSVFSIRHSHVGRELMRYGELKSMILDVNQQAANAWYCTGDQALTEKYVMLVERKRVGQAANHRYKNQFRLISISDLAKVEAERDNLYFNERNNLIFWTLDERYYRITVYKSFSEVFEMKRRIEADMTQRKGPVARYSQQEKTVVTKQKKPQLSPAGYTVYGCYIRKKKIIIRIMAAVFFVLLGMLSWFMWKFQYTWHQILLDIKHFPMDFLLVASLYIVPYCLFYLFVCYMERQVRKSYQRLKYYEQQELDQRVKNEPDLFLGEIFYEQSCFWFRDFRRMCMHNLVLYEDVVWIYAAYGVYQTSFREVPMPNMMMTKIVFYTKDGKKHSILRGNWKAFSSVFPDVIQGYGSKQKQAYYAQLREAKLRKS